MFGNIKIGKKLLFGFAVISLLAGAIGLVGIYKIHRLNVSDTALYEGNTIPLGDIADISVMFQRVRINLRDAVDAKDEEERRGAIETLKQLRQKIDEKVQKYAPTVTDDEEAKAYKEFQETRKMYLTHIERILELVGTQKTEEAAVILHGDAKKAALHEQEVLNRLMDIQRKQAKETAELNTTEAKNTIAFMAGLVALSVVCASALGLLISRAVTVPLSEAVKVANRLSQGDLTVSAATKSTDETGQLMQAMQGMVENLRRIIAGTVDIASGIASASGQLQATSQQIATSTEQVAAQSGTVATASEEMAATSRDIARNCVVAAEASRRSTQAANEGAKVVQATISGMEVIADRVRQSSRTVEALGSRSEQIGNIVGTIEDIADQTNLLALNAAIEAARAGEQGRGFAVVADEVRALAERTTRATKEISDMIKAIQGETREAVKAMEEGVHEVEAGAVTSRKSGEALAEILNRISEVALQVNQIATAAEEQTATTNEVSTNAQQSTEVLVFTAKGAEETATAAAQLARQAQELQEMVSSFKLT